MAGIVIGIVFVLMGAAIYCYAKRQMWAADTALAELKHERKEAVRSGALYKPLHRGDGK